MVPELESAAKESDRKKSKKGQKGPKSGPERKKAGEKKEFLE
jgi:hypothetical protein